MHARERADPRAFDARTIDHGSIVWLAYRLNEPDAERGSRFALYGSAFGASGDVNLACYFDDEGDRKIAESILFSVNDTAPQ